MAHSQILHSRIIRVENGVIALLLLLAAILAVPSYHAFLPSRAEMARSELHQRIRVVAQAAEGEGRTYALVFRRGSGLVRVVRWQADAASAIPQEVPRLTITLTGDAVIERTNLPDTTLVISENGFPLSTGHIVLRAPDGTRTSLDVGEKQ